MSDTTTALAFLVPESQRESINTIRSKYDRASNRWPPHINFLFPFVSPSEFADIKSKLSALSSEASFDVVFEELGFFAQKDNITFHLKPSGESCAKFQNLYKIIRKSLPDVQVKRSDFHPHLTLGQCSKKDWPALEKELKSTWLKSGITMRCDKVVFFHRSPSSSDKMVELESVSLC